MIKALLRFWKMLNYGFASIGIDEPRPLRRTHLQRYDIQRRDNQRREPRHFLTAGERWYALGERLRAAAQKVVGANA